MNIQPKMEKRTRRRSCLGCLGWLLFVLVLVPAAVVGGGWLWLRWYPPFGARSTAKVLLVGLNEPTRGVGGGQRRSDTIILCAAKLKANTAALLSVPRDARVRLPRHRAYAKINAAYSEGHINLLQQTLAQPNVLNDRIPYYLVLDSETTQAVVDAIGGVELTVPVAMNYDDNWGHLHIHLHPGKQRLNGEQVVGYLRWRKNNHGKVFSDDFHRTERQRALLTALAAQAHTLDGAKRLPAAYSAFRRHSWTNMTPVQLAALGWSMRQLHSETVTGETCTIDRVSYVVCDWARARRSWQTVSR